jgi:hypothetical protein
LFGYYLGLPCISSRVYPANQLHLCYDATFAPLSPHLRSEEDKFFEKRRTSSASAKSPGILKL